MYQALYRKWRPQTFDDVIGQNHITSILKSEINNNKISHAYLFCGPRGTGKTTCAKIIAKAVNCENPVDGNPCGKCPACMTIANNTTTDIVEMDAASNNGVNDIRDIRETVVYTPAELKYRVYIIDEVHMLSISAFNALLKTLEEPPAHVIFVLATTELQKIPVTILSRCQRFDFHRVTPNDLILRMVTVCEGEGIEYDESSLELIAKQAQGSFRDALNMLEFCASETNSLTISKTTELLGASPIETLSSLMTSVASGDTTKALETLNEVYLSSRDILVFWRELISFCRDMLLVKSTRGTYKVDDITRKTVESFTISKLLDIVDIFAKTEAEMSQLPQNAKLYAELAIIKVCEPKLDVSLSGIVNRINVLENRLDEGNINISPKKEIEKEPVKKPEQIKPVEKQTVNKPVEQLKLTGISSWAEVVKEVSNISFTLSSILKSAKAFDGNDGNVYIDFPSGYNYALIQLQNEENMNKFISIFNRITKKNITKANIVLRDKDTNIRVNKVNELETW